MAGKVSADDLLAGILEEKGAEAAKDLAKRLKRETGVDIAFTVALQRRKRKHRFDGIGGKAFAVRFIGADLEKLLSRAAAAKAESPGLYLKQLFLDSDIPGEPGGKTVRLPDAVYGIYQRRAEKKGWSDRSKINNVNLAPVSINGGLRRRAGL